MTCAVNEAVLCASHQAEKEIQLAKFQKTGRRGRRSGAA